MAQPKFTLYKYIKFADGSWRYCKAAFYSNGKIKPDRCIIDDKEEEHPEGAYYLSPRSPRKNFRTALRERSQRLVEILIGDRAVAKQELQKRIDKLLLTPKATSTGWVLEVAGSIGVFAGDGDAMLTKSLEGTAQLYTLPRIKIAGIILDPARLAA